ncbi:hypothetical protein ACFL47_08890 [Candidatus Latescibacterota bacterium]
MKMLFCFILFFSMNLDAQEPLEPIQTVEIGKNRECRVNGNPFFPIMSWAQAPENFLMLRTHGINTFCGNQRNVSSQQQSDAAGKAGGYAVAYFEEGAVGHPNLLSWIHHDEPDLPSRQILPNKIISIYNNIKQTDDSRPVMMTLTSNFMKAHTIRYDAETQNKLYPEYVKGADFLGFDTYPIYGWNYPKRLNDPAIGVMELKELTASKKPIYAWIETHKGSKWITFDMQLDVLPKHTRFEVWGAIIRGATAIGYFTHRWRPDFKEFAPTEDMRNELKRLNRQITDLAPAILADPAEEDISIMLSGKLSCHFKATNLEGVLYIFAQNIDLGKDAEKLGQGEDITPRSGTADISVPDLREGTQIEVIGENRNISAKKGLFTDDFAPLAEHIYVIR